MSSSVHLERHRVQEISTAAAGPGCVVLPMGAKDSQKLAHGVKNLAWLSK